jgi:hypothetical protein
MGRHQRQQHARSRRQDDYEPDPALVALGYADPEAGQCAASETLDVLWRPVDTSAIAARYADPTYHRYPVDGVPIDQVQAERDPRSFDDWERMLQPENLHITGGHSSSGRRAKKPVPPATGATPLEIVRVSNYHLPRFKVSPLSLGVWDFFNRRPTLERTVLAVAAARVLADGFWDISVPELPASARYFVTTYGLPEPYARALSTRPGFARLVLVEYAWREGGSRVAAIDGVAA